MLQLDGMQTRVEERGSGYPMILVHGLGGDLQSWNRLWPELDTARRLIRYDLRDFGQSKSSSPGAFTHGNDLASLLDALAVLECDLVGVSMGGGIALNFALDHPERVRSLVLISPQILGWEWSDPWQADWQRITDTARLGGLAEAKRLWWQHPLFASTRRSDAADDLREEIARFDGKQWLEDRHALMMPDIERIHDLQSPTLLLSGLEDVDELQLMADILAASTDRVERLNINGGHLLHMEQPQACARHMAAFYADRFPVARA